MVRRVRNNIFIKNLKWIVVVEQVTVQCCLHMETQMCSWQCSASRLSLSYLFISQFAYALLEHLYFSRVTT